MTSKQNIFSSTQQVASEFDQWAKSGRGYKMAEGHLHATKELLNNLAINQDSIVLDAGCGIGWVLNDLIDIPIAKGVGIDLSVEMITIASDRCKSENISFKTGDTSATLLEDNLFSHIISVESIYYNAEPLKTLKEWFRISNSKGKLGLVIDLYGDNPAAKYWVEALSLDVHNLSVQQWQELLSSAGWTNIVSRRVSLPAQITTGEFTPSAYFPDYQTYLAYCEAGSLLLTAEKPE